MKLLFKTILALMLLLTQEVYSQTAKDEARFKEFWKSFAAAVQAGDTAAFKKMTLEKIDCQDCFLNTFKEVLKFDNFKKKNSGKWQDKSKFTYINSAEFIKKDFDLIFNSTIIRQLALEPNMADVYLTVLNEYIYYSDRKPVLNKRLKTNKAELYGGVRIDIYQPSDTENEYCISGCGLRLGFVETTEGFKLYSLRYFDIVGESWEGLGQ